MKKIQASLYVLILFFGFLGIAKAEIVDFEDLSSGDIVTDQYKNLGIIFSGTDPNWSGRILTIPEFGTGPFGNSVPNIMHIGQRGHSTTMTFVVPGTDIPTVATNISILAGDGNLDSETFTVDIFNLKGDTLFSQTYTTFADGELIQFPGEAASIRFRLEPDSASGVALDDISFTPVPVLSSFDIRKQIEGPDSRTFISGSDVTFEIEVTNTGNVDLTDVEVTDAQVPGCDLFIGDMIAGAVFTYECTAPNVTASFVNEACVTGMANGAQVEDCDPSTVEIIDIDIRKQEEGDDSRTFPPGSDVPFDIVVTNTGDEDLFNVMVTDVLVPACDRDIGDLAAGASFSYTCTAPNVTQGFVNEACVEGERNGVTVGDCDPSTVVIEEVDIDIRKEAEGPDTRTFPSGSDVSFEIVVTNTGQVDLSNVAVTDAEVPGCAQFIGDLAAGVSFSYTCTALDVTASFVNEACVEGEGLGVKVEDCDPSTVEIIDIDIRKQEEGPDTRTFPPGSDVEFEIVVTNTGDEDLENVMVTDVLVPDCDSDIGFLASGDSVTYSCIAPDVTMSFTNEACVSGERNGVTVEDCDPSTVEIEGGGQGCTPGYWKQDQHFDSWTAPFTPDTLFSDVFEDAFPDKTLLEVLGQGGGHLIALGRHTVAALLNAASPDVSYDLTVQEVIDMFNDVFPSGDYEDLKDYFEEFNVQGCPLNNSGEEKGNDDRGGKGKGK